MAKLWTTAGLLDSALAGRSWTNDVGGCMKLFTYDSTQAVLHEQRNQSKLYPQRVRDTRRRHRVFQSILFSSHHKNWQVLLQVAHIFIASSFLSIEDRINMAWKSTFDFYIGYNSTISCPSSICKPLHQCELLSSKLLNWFTKTKSD